MNVNFIHYLPSQLSQLSNRLSSGASDLYLRRFGVGINEWRILTTLVFRPNLSAAEIADSASIHITVVSRSLREMISKELIVVEASVWGRMHTLTEKGTALQNEIAKLAVQRYELLVGGFQPAELEQLSAMLNRLLDNIPRVDAYSQKLIDEARDLATGRPKVVKRRSTR